MKSAVKLSQSTPDKNLLSAETKSLVKKVDDLLDKYIENELMFAKFVKDGSLDEDGIVSDVAIAVHRARKDSISDLVKIRELLDGKPTERVSVEDETNQFSMERLARMKGDS